MTNRIPPSPQAQRLTHLGWTEFFEQQLTELDQLEHIVRILAIRRTFLHVHNGENSFEIHYKYSLKKQKHPVVGDWLLLDPTSSVVLQVLNRKSILQRRVSSRRQMTHSSTVEDILANADGAFIVSSCNDEFNESRLERYLVLCHAADIDITILLTKADLCSDPNAFYSRAKAVAGPLDVHLFNALDPAQTQKLWRYFKPNRTFTLLGSSGVGKSTLINSLTGTTSQKTGAVRATDQRGRHVTTERTLIPLRDGGLVADMPGLRAVGIIPTERGIERCFADLETMALKCKYSNCQHDREPGCYIQKAIESNALSRRRLRNYQKLLLECEAEFLQ